jgi:hypothetical protein
MKKPATTLDTLFSDPIAVASFGLKLFPIDHLLGGLGLEMKPK